MRIGSVVAVVATAVVLTIADSSQGRPVARAGAWLDCGQININVSQIRAYRTTCFYARSVARRWIRTLRPGRRLVNYISPYRCVDRPYYGGLAATIRCTASGGRIVTFEFGD